MRFLLTKKSTNRKTGPVPVSISPKETCPASCSLKNAGCYADAFPMNLHWAKISKGERGLSWHEFLQAVSDLPQGQFWRHNEAGDLRGSKNKIAPGALRSLVEAQRGRRGYSYSHYCVEGEYKHSQNNRKLIKWSNENGFTISLSADTPKQADRLADLNIGPVVTSLHSETEQKSIRTPAGRLVVICPAIRDGETTCLTCGICQRVDRDYILGFPAHGFRKKQMDTMYT